MERRNKTKKKRSTLAHDTAHAHASRRTPPAAIKALSCHKGAAVETHMGRERLQAVANTHDGAELP